MPDSFGPSGPEITGYLRQQIMLHPEKFGLIGSYSREMLEASWSDDYMFAFDQLAFRLCTSVMIGQTVSETPRVEVNLPASWRQHLKYAASTWVSSWLYDNPPTRKDMIPFLWAPFVIAVLLGKFLNKHPVKWTKVLAAVNFEQRVMYPEIDAPAQAGRSVIYETLDVSWPAVQPTFGGSIHVEPSRFLNRHEIANEIYKEPTDSYIGHLSVETLLAWLERQGVNVDQLVKRRWT